MKLSVVLVVVLAAAVRALQPLWDYHAAAGVPEAARIREHEQALGNTRISGGLLMPKGAHPYFAGLIISLQDGRTSMCGATMLRNTKAVTAAHCWWDGRSQAVEFTVVYGSDRLFAGGTRVNTTDVEMHGFFNPVNYRSNIAMVTHREVQYTEFINRVPLPSETQHHTDTWALAVGFGRTTNDPTVYQTWEKRQVMLQLATTQTCRDVWSGQLIGNGVICATSVGGMSVCAGDSGGPLVITSHNGNRTLLGIMSFGVDAACGLGFPAAFTQISYYNGWITDRT